jgi:lipid II:glycine glycyltransferase (peptidoglycan interpeptide bridge formation enzyme)
MVSTAVQPVHAPLPLVGEDQAWDAFVEATPGGHHVQTARWAAVKALVGWRAARVVVRDPRGRIRGGAQVLLRDVPRLGAVGFVPRAPLTAEAEPGAFAEVLEAVHDLARRERVRYLKLQPPQDRGDASDVLRAQGFVPSDLETGPTATVRVDLRRTPVELLAGMRASGRANVRRAQRQGVVVRTGGERDLGAFFAVVRATAERQRFDPYPAQYYREVWRRFAPGDHALLVLAELGGEVLSALLVVGWGDTALFKMGGWTGAHRRVRPNELVHWHAMLWARERGYRWYDLEGIDLEVARALRDGRDHPGAHDGPDRFKLGFGGEVAIFPGAYDRGYIRLLQPAVRGLAPRIGHLRGVAERALGRKA